MAQFNSPFLKRKIQRIFRCSNRKFVVDRSIPRQNNLAPIENLGEYTTNILRRTSSITPPPPKDIKNDVPNKRDHLERTFHLPSIDSQGTVVSLRGSKHHWDPEFHTSLRHFWRFGSDVSAGINTTMLYNFPTWLVLKDQTSRNQKRQASFFFPSDGIYIITISKVNGAFSVLLGWYP